MSHLSYFSYAGEGQKLTEKHGYSQAVRINNRIEISGQGGWDSITGEMSDDFALQTAEAFKNIDVTLRDAGGNGWSQVYKVVTYHVNLGEDGIAPLVENFKKWAPHKPLLTVLGVEKLAGPRMKIEIEVFAELGEE